MMNAERGIGRLGLQFSIQHSSFSISPSGGLFNFAAEPKLANG
jgi:hypothetical protein